MTTRTASGGTPSRAVQLRIGLQLRRRLAARTRYDALDAGGRAAWRDERLAEVRRHSTGASAFYRQLHAGLERAPLDELPVVTKADLVDRFDQIATVPGLVRSDLERRVAPGADGAEAGVRSRADRFRIGTSSGSSGRPALVAFDESEWVDLIANAARARSLAGRPDAAGPVRSAKVGSPSPWHLSHQVPATLHDPRKPSLALAATRPLPELVAELDRWRPTVLSAYPSMLRPLLVEQAAGRLGIRPLQVFSSGEHLSEATRAEIRSVWEVEPFDQYVATEGGFVAAECGAHDGLHVLEDHVIVEVVDDDGRPCAPGEEGRVLITSLHGRTVPLIRYRLDDLVVLADGPCPCGRESLRLASIGGRDRDRIPLAGGAALHPVAVTGVLDRVPVAGWQVLHRPDLLRVLVSGPGGAFDVAATLAALRGVLEGAGVAATVDVEVVVVDVIDQGAGGKAARFVPLDRG